MKKNNYISPAVKVIKLQTESAILADSDSLKCNEEEADVWSSEREYSEDDFDYDE